MMPWLRGLEKKDEESKREQAITVSRREKGRQKRGRGSPLSVRGLRTLTTWLAPAGETRITGGDARIVRRVVAFNFTAP
jgi:hypothetical protein